MKTITDAARELGVTKATVSRALSGKGRVGEETRQRVLDWARANDFTPNSIAKSLAARRSNNIAVVLPWSHDNIFFHKCLMGIAESIFSGGYDALAVIDRGEDLTPVERIVKNGKIDGVILTRIVEDDKIVSYLAGEGVPYLVVGSSPDSGVYQVDLDHRAASAEATRLLLSGGTASVALLAGSERYLVNRLRADGFRDALAGAGIALESAETVWNVWTDNDAQVLPHVMRLLAAGVTGIACADFATCQRVISALRTLGAPGGIRLVSFYNDMGAGGQDYPVSAVCVDTAAFGRTAGKIMMDILSGKDVPRRMAIPYTLTIRSGQ